MPHAELARFSITDRQGRSPRANPPFNKLDIRGPGAGKNYKGYKPDSNPRLGRLAFDWGARVHLEVHRDTCTETPEKTEAIIEGYTQATGKAPLVNFDFSHPAIVKHLNAENYADRLFEDVDTFQQGNLWHMRPFNGHHCQVAVTDGKGNFTPEYEDMRPFIRQA